MEFKKKELGKREMVAEVVAYDIATGKKYKTRQLHFEFRPVGVDWENQHEWYMLTDDIEGAFGILAAKLVELRLLTDVAIREAEDTEVLADLMGQAVQGKQLLWKELETPKKKSTVWLPVKVVVEG